MFQSYRIKKIRRYLFLIFLVPISWWCLTTIGIANTSSLKILKESLGNSIETSSYNNLIEIKYCLENTCEVFQAKIEQKDKLEDFVLLYLFYGSGKTALIFPDEQGLTVIDKIRTGTQEVKKTYLKNCTGDELEIAACILKKLVKKNNISGFDVRYDEGEENISVMDLDTNLAINNLKKIMAWRKAVFIDSK